MWQDNHGLEFCKNVILAIRKILGFIVFFGGLYFVFYFIGGIEWVVVVLKILGVITAIAVWLGLSAYLLS